MSYPLVILDRMTAERQADEALAVMGDDEFRAFYERTARPLWAYLSRLSGDPNKADDFLQEAYYRFYRASKRYESEAHRRNSLFQIATTLLRDAARLSERVTAEVADLAMPNARVTVTVRPRADESPLRHASFSVQRRHAAFSRSQSTATRRGKKLPASQAWKSPRSAESKAAPSSASATRRAASSPTRRRPSRRRRR